jgi:hypothetical protein
VCVRQVIRFQDILKHADSEIGNLNSKKMELQEELAKEEAEEQQKEALKTQVAEVPTRSSRSYLKHSVVILSSTCIISPMAQGLVLN